MPKKLRIGPITYELIKVDCLRDGDQKLDGHIKFGPCTIEIEESLSPQARCQVIWHEILHGLLTQAGYRKHDEVVLDVLSYGIMGVLQDNPWLMEPEDDD